MFTQQEDFDLKAISTEAIAALNENRQIRPFSEKHKRFQLSDAYRLVPMFRSNLEDRGEEIIGRKIGFTNHDMWAVYEHRRLGRQLKSLPDEVLKRYEKWQDIVAISGPEGLRLIKGFHDESLRGEWKGHRSSRLGLKYRVIYRIVRDEVLVQVVNITPHDYRRK